MARDPRITLMNIDQINRTLKIRRHRMTHSLNQAEQLVTAAAKQHVDIFQLKGKSLFRNVAAIA